MDLHGDSPVRRRAASASTVAPWQNSFWKELPAETFESLSPASQIEIQNLREVSDPETLAQSLLSFAARREREGSSALAAQLYQKISRFSECPENIRLRAENRALALQSEGSVGAQSEVLISRFSDQALAPAPIVAMGIAGGVFKISRALSLNVLRQGTVDLLLAKASANSFGLLAESAAFTLTAKGVNSALGHAQNWSSPALMQEWLAGTMLLGSLKAGGAVARQTSRGLLQAASETEALVLKRGFTTVANASHPLSLYGGILLSHHAETGLGLRPAQSTANSLVDGAATLLHLYVGGQFANLLGAARINRAASELETRIENLPRRNSFLSNFFNPRPVIAMAGKAGERAPDSLTLDKNHEVVRPMQATALSPESERFLGEVEALTPESKRVLVEAYAVRDFSEKLPPPTVDTLRRLFYHYEPLSTGSAQHQFQLLLSRTTIGRDPTLLDAAIPTLVEAGKTVDRGSLGAYSNWLLKQAFDDCLRRSDAGAMDQLLRFLANGGRTLELERRLANTYPGLELPKGPPPLPHFWTGRENLYGRIRNLSFSPASKIILSKWAIALARGGNPLSFGQGNFNLIDMLEYHQGIPTHVGPIERALAVAGDSALGMARMARLQTILAKKSDPLTEFRLAELGDPELKIFGRHNPWVDSDLATPSQANAYLGGRAPTALMAEMRARRSDLMNPENIASRRTHRDAVIDGMFPNGVRNQDLRPEVLAEAFRRLGDPLSIAVSRSIQNRDFQMEILPLKAFQHRANEFSSVQSAELDNAYYYPPQGTRRRGLMLFRQPEFTVYSQDSAREAFFVLMASVVHEFRHHVEIDPGQKRTKEVHLYQEMSAHFAEYLWKAGHGDVHDYAMWTTDAALGPAMRFHDYYENAYGRWWEGLASGQSTLRAGRQGP